MRQIDPIEKTTRDDVRKHPVRISLDTPAALVNPGSDVTDEKWREADIEEPERWDGMS